MAVLWKMICNLGDPMGLRHPVPSGTCTENDGEEKGKSMARTSNNQSEVESVSRNATRCRLLCQASLHLLEKIYTILAPTLFYKMIKMLLDTKSPCALSPTVPKFGCSDHYKVRVRPPPFFAPRNCRRKARATWISICVYIYIYVYLHIYICIYK